MFICYEAQANAPRLLICQMEGGMGDDISTTVDLSEISYVKDLVQCLTGMVILWPGRQDKYECNTTYLYTKTSGHNVSRLVPF